MRLHRGIALLLPLLLSPVFAQIDNSGLLPFMPADVQRIRENQVEAALAAGVTLGFHDEGMRSVTSILGVPTTFRSLNVPDEQVLIPQIEELYPLLGFRDTETLRYDGKLNVQELARYRFQQYINEIPTPLTLEIDVNNDTGIVLGFRGNVALDRGFARASRISYADAIDCAKARYNASFGTEFDAIRVYEWGASRALEPWWLVGSKRPDGRLNASFYLLPDGRLQSAEIRSHSRGERELGSCHRSQAGEMIFQPN